MWMGKKSIKLLFFSRSVRIIFFSVSEKIISKFSEYIQNVKREKYQESFIK